MTGSAVSAEARKEAGKMFRDAVVSAGVFKKLAKHIKLFGATKLSVTLTVTWNDGRKSNHVVDLLKPEGDTKASPRTQ